MVMARVVQFVKRAPRGFSFCRLDMLKICIQLILINLLPVAFCASAAVVYEIGDEVAGTDENFMWVDRNPYFEAAMLSSAERGHLVSPGFPPILVLSSGPLSSWNFLCVHSPSQSSVAPT